MFKNSRIKPFETEVAIKAHNSIVETGQEIIDGPVSVHLKYDCMMNAMEVTIKELNGHYHPKKKDIQNLGEIILDVVQGILIRNDSQVREFYVVSN